MQFLMFTWSNRNKIANVIIERIMVNMVYDFATWNFPFIKFIHRVM